MSSQIFFSWLVPLSFVALGWYLIKRGEPINHSTNHIRAAVYLFVLALAISLSATAVRSVIKVSDFLTIELENKTQKLNVTQKKVNNLNGQLNSTSTALAQAKKQNEELALAKQNLAQQIKEIQVDADHYYATEVATLFGKANECSIENELLKFATTKSKTKIDKVLEAMKEMGADLPGAEMYKVLVEVSSSLEPAIPESSGYIPEPIHKWKLPDLSGRVHLFQSPKFSESPKPSFPTKPPVQSKKSNVPAQTKPDFKTNQQP